MLPYPQTPKTTSSYPCTPSPPATTGPSAASSSSPPPSSSSPPPPSSSTHPTPPSLSPASASTKSKSSPPHASLCPSLSLSLTVRVSNRDAFSLKYSSINVSVGYRGRQLGLVTSDGGEVRAWGSSYVNATVVVDGLEVVHDVVYLVEDLARGLIPFDTESVVEGTVGIFFVDVPIQARVSCEIYVSTNNQTVTRQECYSEALL